MCNCNMKKNMCCHKMEKCGCEDEVVVDFIKSDNCFLKEEKNCMKGCGKCESHYTVLCNNNINRFTHYCQNKHYIKRFVNENKYNCHCSCH